MKIRNFVIAGIAAATAASALSAAAAAYELNKDLGFGWSASITIPAEEFEGATENSVFTITYTADASLAEMDGQNYWCIKTMVNDAGWPFVDDLVGAQLSDGKDSYVLDVEGSEMKFTIPADSLELFSNAGMAIMGHGVTLGEITFSNDEQLPVETEAAPAETEAPAEAPAETTAVVSAASDSKGGNPPTGAGLSVGAAVFSFAVAALTKKIRKN